MGLDQLLKCSGFSHTPFHFSFVLALYDSSYGFKKFKAIKNNWTSAFQLIGGFKSFTFYFVTLKHLSIP